MAYNPGVQSMGGQILGQGIADFGQSLAQGFKEYQQNKMMAGNAIAQFEAAMSQNPELLQQLESGQIQGKVSSAYNKLKTKGAVGVDDASLLATFATTAEDAKRKVQQAKIQAQQLAEMERKAKQSTQDQQAFGQADKTSPESFLQSYSSAGGSIGGLKDLGFDVDKFLFPSQTGQGPTAAMKDTDAILEAEIKTGKIKTQQQLLERRAELLSQGGRDAIDVYRDAGAYIDNKGNAVRTVFSNKKGMIGVVKQDGSFEALPSGYKPVTLGDVNALLDPAAFETLRKDLITDENSINSLKSYLKGRGGLTQGIGQIADRLNAIWKTSVTKQPLSPEEESIGLSDARLQGVLGMFRTSVVGPGVMTEQDAERIIRRFGGSVSAFTNPEVVKQAIREVLMLKYNEYEDRLNVYNTHVAQKYSQAGRSQRQKIDISDIMRDDAKDDIRVLSIK